MWNWEIFGIVIILGEGKMKEYTYIEILVEDKSGKILLEKIMEKYTKEKKMMGYRIHSFKGIGRIPLKIQKISQIKTRSLLTDLPAYLKGMDSSLKNMQGRKAIFVILDADQEDCGVLKRRLVQMYEELELSIQVFFCLAIEEIEAWLLGDSEALLTAYPMAKRQILQKYVQDSVIGTWECLADIVYKGGFQALKRNAPSYHEIGIFKCECAQNIGDLLNIRKNNSQSFNYFINKLDLFCNKG